MEIEEEESSDDELHSHSKDYTSSRSKNHNVDRDGRQRGADVYIAEGVYTDCESILRQFLSLQTSTFEDFVKIWKERKFSHIYIGRDSFSELMEFSEEVLTIAKSFILPPHSQIKRIGGLYLMYGLYNQQPIRDHFKFRVTPEEWSVILKFVENLKAHGFIDANYIFHKMCLDGAFLTVAFSREYGLERNYRKYLMPWPARDNELVPSETFSLETLMGRVCRGSLKADADKFHRKYNNVKQILEAKKHSKFQSVRGTEKPLEEVLQDHIEDAVESLGGTKRFPNSNIGLGRKDLKDKAFRHQSHHKNLQSVVLPDIEHNSTTSTTASTTASTSQSSSQSRFVPEISDDEMLTNTDSEDSDFEYMVKPPSMRNSRKIKSRKIALKQKKESFLGKSKCGRAAHKASYEEVTGQKAVSRKSLGVGKGRGRKKQAGKDLKTAVIPMLENNAAETSVSFEESCPDLEVSDFESPNTQSRKIGNEKAPAVSNPANTSENDADPESTIGKKNQISTVRKSKTPRSKINNKKDKSSEAVSTKQTKQKPSGGRSSLRKRVKAAD